MRKICLFVFAALMMSCWSAKAQVSSNISYLHFNGVPSGSCSTILVAENDATGDFYDCVAGAWYLAGGGSGGGGAALDLSNLTNPTAIALPTLTFDGAAGLTAGGTNQNITLTPSGLGQVTITGSGTGSTNYSLLNLVPPNGSNYLQMGQLTFSYLMSRANWKNVNASFATNGTAFDSSTNGAFYFLSNGKPSTLPTFTINNLQTTTTAPLFQLQVAGSNVLWASQSGAITTSGFNTSSNCSSSSSPAACGSAPAGYFVIAAGATSVVVDTTAVTANSEIMLTEDQSLGTALGVTCNTSIAQPVVGARTAGTSFTVSIGTAFTTNPGCFSYALVN